MSLVFNYKDYLEVFLYLLTLGIFAPFLGKFMAGIFAQKDISKLEKSILTICGTNSSPQNWKDYSLSLLFFNLVGLIFLFVILMLPALDSKSNISWHLAFNTAVSFVTNTNWQPYSGESTFSPFTQMMGLAVQNFLSAATGIVVVVAMARGFVSKGKYDLGNFWVDMIRTILKILLPLSFILAILLLSQGVVQTLSDKVIVKTLEGVEQTIPLGPVASQVAIKQLGTNGGGYFGTNSAHPLENPTPFSNFLQMISILLLPAACVFMFGHLMNEHKQAKMIFAVMSFLFLIGLTLSIISEGQLHPDLKIKLMEGKEVRFGIMSSTIWSSATTAASNGSVNAMHSSLSPLTSLVAMFNMMLGEIIFGGVGSGLYGILIFILLTVFLTGLMIGRTPEIYNKKIEIIDMKMCIIALIAPSFVILMGPTLSLVTEAGLSSIFSKGPHALSELLYNWASIGGNNGSAFAGLNANTAFYNSIMGIGMLIGRFGVIFPCLYIAGSFAQKKYVAESAAKMPTDSLLFGILLVAIIVIVGALTFFPAILLGPLSEFILYLNGISF